MDRLLDVGIESPVGIAGDTFENALAETVMGLFNTKVIYQQACRGREGIDWVAAEGAVVRHEATAGAIGDFLLGKP